MRTRAMRRVEARYRWDRLRVSFWFAPAIMALAAVLLAWALYWLDLYVSDENLESSRFVLSGSPSDMRSALLNIAGTVLATAGVVFTLLTLPLSTVAAQYGSRLLRVFLGDRTTQLVLGLFVGTFVYCIAGALSIPPVEMQPEGPQLTATMGLYLMLATFASLILLVQHISTMLQAPNIAAAAGAVLLDGVRMEPLDETMSFDKAQTGQGDLNALAEMESYSVRVMKTGYIQTIAPETLLTLAREKDLVIRLVHRPGRFVSAGAVVAEVWPAGRINQQVEGQIRNAFRLGNQRTPTQDVECAVNQLVEMAVRAMSPAINDPFTAITCLDHMGNALALFALQGEENLISYDQNGKLRLVLEPVTFAVLLSAAFDMLRHASCDNASVLLHMLDVIDLIGREVKTPEARQPLLHHVSLIEAESQAGALIEQDRHTILLSSQALRARLEGAF